MSMFQTAGAGLHPSGPFTMDCGDMSATKTFVGLKAATPAVYDPPPLTPEFGFCLNAAKLVNVIGLPAGLTVQTDVMSTADSSSPFGIWQNTGVYPNNFPSIGCISIVGDALAWSDALSTDPNGIYPLTLTFDFRTDSLCMMTGVAPVGVWWFEESGAPGAMYLTITTELRLNESGCAVPFYVYPATFADDLLTPECDGSVNVAVYGGTPPFTYAFSSGVGNGAQQEELCEGIYGVAVTDATGATVEAPFAVASGVHVYSNILDTASLYQWGYGQLEDCDINYDLPIDSFHVADVWVIGSDTLTVLWEVFQQGDSYLLEAYYEPMTINDGVNFSLMVFCQDSGRAAPKIIQLMDQYIATGMNEFGAAGSFKIYPNPSNGLITLDMGNITEAHVAVTDIVGRPVLDQKLYEHMTTLDLSHLSSGTYLVHLIAPKGRWCQKLVKQ